MASVVEEANDSSSVIQKLPLDELMQTVSEPDRVLLELAISLQKSDSFSSIHDVAQYLLSLRYQLCKQFFQDLPADLAKKFVESTATANETVSAKVYGEIEFASFFSILQELRPKQGDSIVDIGHGTGKALIAALILCGPILSRIHGVDIVPEVVEESRRRIEKVGEYIADASNVYSPFLKSCLGGRSLTEVITVETGDLLSDELEFDWTEADIVFANSTCFGFELMDKLSQKAERMKPGAQLVTFTLPLRSSSFTMKMKRNYVMSWGIATVYFHVRNAV